MDRHLEVLKKIAASDLTEHVDASSGMDLTILRELIDDGKISAIDASSHDGPEFLDVRITLDGRQYLRELEEEKSPPPGRRLENLLKKSWVIVIVIALGSSIMWFSSLADTVRRWLPGGAPPETQEVASYAQIAVVNMYPFLTDPHVDEPLRFRRLTEQTLPSLKKLESHPQAMKALGATDLRVLERVIIEADGYLTGTSSPAALRSHFQDLTRILVFFIARSRDDDRFKACQRGETLRRCDQILTPYVERELMH